MNNLSRYLILVLTVLAATSCAASTSADRIACPSSSSKDYFFASGTLDPANSRADDFVRGWYSEQLAAMGEPSISCGEPQDVYRLTWLRTFHHPVAVRVTAQGEQAILHAIELDGAGGYEPGKVLRRNEKVLSHAEFDELRRAFSEARFGSMPTSEGRLGLDGAEWILEAFDENGYHIVVRWSPDDGPVRDIGNLFLALTGWKFDEMY